eukprot:798650-Pyramimonas_sp.AAC.1
MSIQNTDPTIIILTLASKRPNTHVVHVAFFGSKMNAWLLRLVLSFHICGQMAVAILDDVSLRGLTGALLDANVASLGVLESARRLRQSHGLRTFS